MAVTRLAIAPGERADVVVDFAEHRGEQILLNNLRLHADAVPRGGRKPSRTRARCRRLFGLSRRSPSPTRSGPGNSRSRKLDNLLGEPMTHLLDGKRWHEPVSEKPVLGTTEIWELLNLTDDAHPIHLHLVRFQILDRRPIDVSAWIYDKKVRLYGGRRAARSE